MLGFLVTLASDNWCSTHKEIPDIEQFNLALPYLCLMLGDKCMELH